MVLNRISYIVCTRISNYYHVHDGNRVSNRLCCQLFVRVTNATLVLLTISLVVVLMMVSLKVFVVVAVTVFASFFVFVVVLVTGATAVVFWMSNPGRYGASSQDPMKLGS
jgi:hypothetical protein